MRSLVQLLDALEHAGRAGSATLRLATDAVARIAAAHARRFSSVSASLPPVQSLAQRVIAFVLLLGFVLVDLGAPRLEALLFGTITGCFFLINSFLSDLADPFGGSWSVGPAKEEVQRLALLLAATDIVDV